MTKAELDGLVWWIAFCIGVASWCGRTAFEEQGRLLRQWTPQRFDS